MTTRARQVHYTPTEWAALGPRLERNDRVVLDVVEAAALVVEVPSEQTIARLRDALAVMKDAGRGERERA